MYYQILQGALTQTPDLSDLVEAGILDGVVMEDGYDPTIAADFEATFARNVGSPWEQLERQTERKRRTIVSLLAALIS